MLYRPARRLTIGLGLLLMLSPAGAETLFIVDRIEAELHAEKTTDSPVLVRLPTGTPVDVLNRTDSWIEVRTSDGTRGWIEATYLMEDKPSRQLLNEAEAELARARAELERLREESTTSGGGLNQQQRIRDRLEQQLAAEREQVAELRARINREQPVARSTGTGNGGAVMPVQWLQRLIDKPDYLLAAVAVLLLIGMLWGLWLADFLNRRRHGGFRL